MDMGMVLQGSSPSVKDAEETRQVGADVMGIGGEFFNRFRGGLKQCGVSGALVFSDEGAQLFWDRKSDEKMVGGELALELFLKPLSGFVGMSGSGDYRRSDRVGGTRRIVRTGKALGRSFRCDRPSSHR
jgi:hypothetical protein